jgi:hypothetical protein
MINVADGANAYVHPNHSGEVTSTADGATVIAGNIVDEANLKVSNAPTNGYFLSAQSGDTGGMTWAAAGGGKVLQVVTTQTGAFASGTTTVPIDNTIMQITEGDEYMSLAITPTSATSRLFIQVQALLSSSALGFITGSIFQDTTAGALATSLAMQTDAVRQPRVLPLNHNMVAGTTSATTFKFRAGLQISNTTYFNGTASQLWGGVGASSITITEYTP